MTLRINDNLFAAAHGERCLPEECRAACCPGGIWVDILHVQRILAATDAIRPHLAPEHGNEDEWFGDEELDHADFPSGLAIPTAVKPRAGEPTRTGCVFLRADHRCGLQVASEVLGLAWPGLKPFDCATYPLSRSEGELAYDSETTAAHPHADCQQARTTPPRPRYVVFRQEVELAIGCAGWQRLHDRAQTSDGTSE